MDAIARQNGSSKVIIYDIDEADIARYNVEKLQREIEEQREEMAVALDFQRNEQILHLEQQLSEAEVEQMNLEQESRNSVYVIFILSIEF
jgi:hypothetical protein